MANVPMVQFGLSILADGVSTTFIVDLTDGPVSFFFSGVPSPVNAIIPSAKLATGVVNVHGVAGITESSISKGVLTVTFDPAPPLGENDIVGILLF